MKNVKWILAGALVGFGGVAMADDVRAHSDEVERDAQRAGNEAREEGEEIRTGMERNAEEAERKIEEGADDARQQVGEAAQDAEQGARQAGSAVAESIGEANSAVQGQPSRLPRGELDDGAVRNTLTTNTLGYFTGTGLNVTYSRPLSDKFSGVAGASFARASAGDGAATRVGLEVGADYYLLGARNEGLRLGPRISAGLGGETTGDNSFFGSLGAAAEVGYNWISAKGLTAGLGAGVGAGFGANTDGALSPEEADNFEADWSPYARLNIGYSW